MYRHKELFLEQISALFKAANDNGPINVMLPMVCIVKDVVDYMLMVEQVRKNLFETGEITKDNITWGLMIETPSAALISDQLAPYAAFFSIGTNDLTQYTLAADRLNVDTAAYYNPLHPSVLKLMEITVKNAKAQGIEVCVCGESASDALCAKTYVEMGIHNLSMAQNAMIPIKQHLIDELGVE